MHKLAVEDAVGACEVDVLEGAEGVPALTAHVDAAQALAVDLHRLAGLQFAQQLGADVVESARLRRDNPAAAEHADAQGPDAKRVPEGDQLLGRQRHHRVGALQPPHHVAEPLAPRRAGSVCHQLRDNLGVRRRREPDAPLVLQLRAEAQRVDDVPVMAQGDASVGPRHLEWLRVVEVGRAGGGVASVPNGHIAGQPIEVEFVEGLAYEPHLPSAEDGAAVGGSDARRLLPSML